MKRTKCHFIPTVGFTYKGNEIAVYLTGQPVSVHSKVTPHILSKWNALSIEFG